MGDVAGHDAWNRREEAHTTHEDRETEIAATKDEPRYLVKSAKTGKLAAHTPEALKKRS